MTQNELNKIIENHQHYLNKDIDGWESMRADLSDKNLSGLNLKNANLREANFRNANLSNANLGDANLNNADLAYADLRKADLRKADLRDSDLRKADLRKADLREANLYRACCLYTNLGRVDLSNAYLRDADLYSAFCCYTNLYGVDLRSADLRDANLSGADLRKADLREANLRNAYLSGTDLSEDTKIDCPIACPETGSFIGYKKAICKKIVKLQICEDAKRSSATTKKCRCSKALVLAIENMDGFDSRLQEIESRYDPCFIYRVGEIAEVPDFDNDRWNECAPGIHFFMDRQDAVEY
jgi:uncharacterized protein YjbI with pentapeptide repeats